MKEHDRCHTLSNKQPYIFHNIQDFNNLKFVLMDFLPTKY
jgi:hypothetical protein